MSYSLGNATITPGQTGNFTTPTGIGALIIGNQSGYTLDIQLEGGNQKVLYPGTADYFVVTPLSSGVVFFTPTASLPNILNLPGQTITFDAVGKNEKINASAYPMSISAIQAVSPTASGNALFTAIFGVGSSAGNNQSINVFNPANSNTTLTFHSARAFTNSADIPTANLIYLAGADLNLPVAVTPGSHSGQATPPASVAHCTGEDTNAGHGGSAIEVLRVPNSPTNGAVDILAFPDNVTLAPGGNMRLSLADSSTGHIVEVALKWSEVAAVAPTGVVPVTNATGIVQDNFPLVSQVMQVTPAGGPGGSSIRANNDGTWILNILQAGVYHQFLKSQTSGNPLQLGQAGDIAEILGQLTIDQVLNALANIILANSAAIQIKDSGGTARKMLWMDSTNATNLQAAELGGNVYIDDEDTSTILYFNKASGIVVQAGGITLPHGSIIHAINYGSVSVSNAAGGTTVNHGLGATPLGIQATQQGAIASGGTAVTVQVSNLTSTQFTLHTNINITVYWLAYA